MKLPTLIPTHPLVFTVNIDVIKEVRDGECTDILKRLGPSSSQYNPSCCFSIVYGTAWESLDLIADDREDAEMWIAGLRYLITTSKRDQLRIRSQEHRDQYPFFPLNLLNMKKIMPPVKILN